MATPVTTAAPWIDPAFEQLGPSLIRGALIRSAIGSSVAGNDFREGVITAARRFESEILRAGLAGEGSHFDTKTTGFLLHLVALVFDAGLPAQRRLVNIEPRCNIAPTDFCRVKLQGVT